MRQYHSAGRLTPTWTRLLRGPAVIAVLELVKSSV
jgi:hypothetical protein